jgi:aspartate dehydrogenase
MKHILLIGYGAMGRTVAHELRNHERVGVRYVLERAHRQNALAQALAGAANAIASLDEMEERPDFALECAGHDAVVSIVPQLLQRGIPTIIASIGALAREGVPERLETAARAGSTQLRLAAGAVAGIDALSAARRSGLTEVRYIGRKPPTAWLGTPCEAEVDLRSLSTPTVIFEGDARTAARLYPRNANVAATVALAGIGLERTRVSLFADPAVTHNVHAIEARGAFGELSVSVMARPLKDNSKTSALAAYSIVRAITGEVEPLVI